MTNGKTGGAHLDLLRGVAVLLVFVLHLYGATYWINEFRWVDGFPDQSSAFHKSMWIFYPYTLGFLGVPLFFVLSGYCIHSSYLNYTRKNPQAFSFRKFLLFFFVRRFWRIYPIYIVALVAFTLIRGTGEQGSMLSQLLSHLSLTHNLSAHTFSTINGAFWTLAYEWQLYCIYPLLLLILRKRGPNQMIAFALIIGTSADLVALFLLPDTFPVVWSVLRSRYLFTWAFGMYLCERHQKTGDLFPDNKLLYACALLVTCATTQYEPTRAYAWQISAFVFGWSIEVLAKMELNNLLSRSLAFMGMISYSFYLFHGPLIEGIIHSRLKTLLSVGYPYNQMTVGAVLLVLLPICAISWLTYHLVERPCHNYGVKQSGKLL